MFGGCWAKGFWIDKMEWVVVGSDGICGALACGDRGLGVR